MSRDETILRLGVLAGMLSQHMHAHKAVDIAIELMNSGNHAPKDVCMILNRAEIFPSAEATIKFARKYGLIVTMLPIMDECVQELPLTLAEITQPSLN